MERGKCSHPQDIAHSNNALCRYANVDFAFRKSVQTYLNHPYLLVSYDIACQYSRNLTKHLLKGFPDIPQLRDLVEWTIFAVPKLHIQGHKDDCQYQYLLNYIEGAGCTARELIETSWAEMNNVGPSTRKMNPGHCHDVLNDLYGDWNWRKVKRMCMSFVFPI